MVRLKQIAQCIGLSGSFSIRRDFLGYFTDFTGRRTSLLEQIRLLQNRHISLNIIRVGVDNFTPADWEEIDNAVQITRNIYAAVNFGIGRVEHFEITVANANGRDIITDDADAQALTTEWTVPNTSVDVFFVLMGWPGRLGLAPREGPCNKNTAGMTGSVVALERIPGKPETTGIVLAHEVGHYLGLRHNCEFATIVDNVIPPGGCNPWDRRGASTDPNRIFENDWLMYPRAEGKKINDSDAANIRDHCFVQDGCVDN